jgi:hypothetical protein
MLHRRAALPPPLPFSRRGQCPRHSAYLLLVRPACSQRGPRADDKRLQNTLKRLGVNTIPGIEEVNLFKVRNIGSRCRHDTRGLAITLVPVCRLCPLSARGVERGRPGMEMRGPGGGTRGGVTSRGMDCLATAPCVWRGRCTAACNCSFAALRSHASSTLSCW